MAQREHLFAILVEPLLAALPLQGEVVFVPDKELQAIPFSCLVNRHTGRAVLQDFRLTIAPSATAFVRLLERRNLFLGRKTMSALSVGNPAFDRAKYPSFIPLPQAESEARRVAEMYPGSVLLLGKDATQEKFLGELDRHDIVHYAGHTVFNRSDPLGSALLFAPSRGGTSGELSAGTIYSLRLTRPRLIVLSACNTATGDFSPLEGVLDLARPFIAAGVPAVVASLWRVNDVASRKLLGLFYLSLYRTRDPIYSLREAQLTMLYSSDARFSAPATWAAFQVIGTTPSQIR
jgi:CHAT domain-containing protein